MRMKWIFLDSNRANYLNWWPHIKRIVRADGLLVVDNATSRVEELMPFMEVVRDDGGGITSLSPIGNGEFLASRL